MIPFPVGSRNCSLPHSVETSSKAYQVLYPVGNDERGLSQETKRSERESDYSLSSSVEVKNKWSCHFRSPIHLHVMHKDKFTFAFI